MPDARQGHFVTLIANKKVVQDQKPQGQSSRLAHDPDELAALLEAR